MSGIFGGSQRALLHVRDEQTAGTQGGTFSNGAWRTRVLNTEVVNEIAGASLASNQITLPPGDYEVFARAPAYYVDDHKAKLRDATGGADLVIGASVRAFYNTNAQTDATVLGRFSLSAESVLELQHRCTQATGNASGFGVGGNISTEVFAEVLVWKVG